MLFFLQGRCLACLVNSHPIPLQPQARRSLRFCVRTRDGLWLLYIYMFPLNLNLVVSFFF